MFNLNDIKSPKKAATRAMLILESKRYNVKIMQIMKINLLTIMKDYSLYIHKTIKF